MTLARFTNICVNQLGAVRPIIPVLLSTKAVEFSSPGEAQAAKELLLMDDKTLDLHVIPASRKTLLQLANAE